jgi:ketosteroid isomerase-like protein
VLSAEDRLAIEALHRAWLDAELRGDASALLDLCTPTPVWLPPSDAPLCGKEAILHWLGDQPYTAVLRIDIDELAIAGVGSFAWKLASSGRRSKVRPVMPEW